MWMVICDVCTALLCDGLLSVAHISDDEMSILEPLEITDTHVVVKISHLSAFSRIWDTILRIWNKIWTIKGQVLLFLRPTGLNVFLLNSNVDVTEVKARQRGATNIPISADCRLNFGQSYSLHCEPEGFTIQPDRASFYSGHGPNYHPTFEVLMTTIPEKVTLMVKDQEGTDVWKREVRLTDLTMEIRQRNVPAEESMKWLRLVRTKFIKRISEANLNLLLDELLHHGVINDEEKDSIRTNSRSDTARGLIDTVKSKGPEASRVLIAALREVDPCVFKVLNLKLKQKQEAGV